MTEVLFERSFLTPSLFRQAGQQGKGRISHRTPEILRHSWLPLSWPVWQWLPSRTFDNHVKSRRPKLEGKQAWEAFLLLSGIFAFGYVIISKM